MSESLINQLESVHARMRRGRPWRFDELMSWANTVHDAHSELTRLRAEIDRYRKALDRIKARAYKLGQGELYDMARGASQGETP